MAVTAKDVAEACGVSRITVNRALSGNENVKLSFRGRQAYPGENLEKGTGDGICSKSYRAKLGKWKKQNDRDRYL